VCACVCVFLCVHVCMHRCMFACTCACTQEHALAKYKHAHVYAKSVWCVYVTERFLMCMHVCVFGI